MRCHAFTGVRAGGLKKSLRAGEQERPDVAARRRYWRGFQRYIDIDSLVFIDETGLNTKMIRLYGWARGGQRCVGRVPHGHWRTSTFICGLRRQEIAAPFVVDRPMNADIFQTYIARVLGPELRPGDVVIMDNLAAHKRPNVQSALKRYGATALYLPPYSPDLNPIEMAFAKLKAILRSAEERTVDALWNRLTYAIENLTPKDCENFFKHAGYA